MFRQFLILAAAVSVAAVPTIASAQNASTPTPSAPKAAPAAPAVAIPLKADPDQSHDLENILYLDLSNGQRVAIRLLPEWAPTHVERIKTLTRQGFYDGVKFHRVIDGFMAQTGDPTGTGRGGSTLPDIKAEFNAFPHVRGTVSMARAASDDSANSQFFIVFYPRFTLDRKYTNFGRVIAGMDAVDRINRGEPPTDPTYITQASIAADHKAPKFTLPAPLAAAPPAPPAPAANAPVQQ